MKLTKILLTSALALGISSAANSQAQINLGGSYLKGTSDNDAALWGGGVGLKFFLGDKFAVGGNVGFYPKKTGSVSNDIYDITYSNNLTTIAGSIEYLFTDKKSVIQPYLGADAGVSLSTINYTYSDGNSSEIRNKNNGSYFLVGPKLGVNIGLGQAFGIFGQAKYNLTFGDGGSKSINWGNAGAAISEKPVDKFFTFDAGIYIRLAGAR